MRSMTLAVCLLLLVNGCAAPNVSRGVEASSAPTSAATQPTRDEPIWRFCDVSAPERGFCVSLEGARELQRRNILREQLHRSALAEAQAQSDAAMSQSALIGGVLSAAALVLGGVVGVFVGWRLAPTK